MRDLVGFLWSSTTLALRGSLLQDFWGTALRAAAASAVGALVGILAAYAGGPLWLATLLGGLVAGGVTPFLLRNIKIA
ncbi:MAG: hypothetical protein HGA45_08610 [Chloroflexales bacterium]|nr:hypothetical protein [Chloroflexales bacterium]